MGKYISRSTWEKITHYCVVCEKELPPGTRVYEAHDNGCAGDDCCSMACARKALGIEAASAKTCADICESLEFIEQMCVSRHADCFHDGCRTGCVNYMPEAACANYEPEAEEWEWGEDLGNKDRKPVQVHRGLISSNRSRRIVMVHEAYFDIDEADRDLIAAAPQTARDLKAAKAERNRLAQKVAALQYEVDQHAALRAKTDAALGKGGA